MSGLALVQLNTFETDETLCSKPEDLSSGHYLLACLATL